eukprot:6149020-Pleurochrysis_carterae.AAC.5
MGRRPDTMWNAVSRGARPHIHVKKAKRGPARLGRVYKLTQMITLMLTAQSCAQLGGNRQSSMRAPHLDELGARGEIDEWMGVACLRIESRGVERQMCVRRHNIT